MCTEPVLPFRQSDVEWLVPVFKLLANRERLLLVLRLAESELTVGQLEQELQIRQPTLSQQLAVLREHGILGARRSGKFIHYRLRSPAVHRIAVTLCALPLSARLHAAEACADPD